MPSRRTVVALGLLGLSACKSETPVASTPVPRPTATAAATPLPPGVIAAPADAGALARAIPPLAEREARFAQALAGSQPIVLLQGDLDDKRQRAQGLAAASEKLRFFARDQENGRPLRSEIMGVRPALPADLKGATAGCTKGACYRVEMFNYSTNGTAVATVDVEKSLVLDVAYHPDTQPEIPPYLADLAAQIAIHSPEVAGALGFKPGVGLAGMPNVKTALNGSECERSHHLCVAPTFLLHDQRRALWAIVDLTDGRLVGVRWTDLGQGNSQPVTEQGLQDAVVMSEYCETAHAISRDGWDVTYVLTPSDGLEIKDVRFHGRTVLQSAKLVDSHVSYSGTDGFGYSDAMGCPQFSTASVVAFNGPAVEALAEPGQEGGFALVQDFRSELWPLSCNYRYLHRYEFHADGRLWVGAESLGRGCGNNGTYRLVFRTVLAPGADAEHAVFSQWEGAAWKTWDKEGWVLQALGSPPSPEGQTFRVLGADGAGYFVSPTFGPPGMAPADSVSYLYLSAHRPEEGDADMITIGPCCNTDYRQGPEKFIEPPEPLTGRKLVLWFSPRLRNSDQPGKQYCWTETVLDAGIARPKSYPCTAGLMFTPIP